MTMVLAWAGWTVFGLAIAAGLLLDLVGCLATGFHPGAGRCGVGVDGVHPLWRGGLGLSCSVSRCWAKSWRPCSRGMARGNSAAAKARCGPRWPVPLAARCWGRLSFPSLARSSGRAWCICRRRILRLRQARKGRPRSDDDRRRRGPGQDRRPLRQALSCGFAMVFIAYWTY